ncbi:MAG TPA: hypothetical protein VHT91_10155 [Kofleriaceae bacterium]|jgi:hypothetical protein|nr:hypothetical protein [Kofleriaceae bacterium]
MVLDRSFKFTSLLFATLAGLSGVALAHPAGGAQVCTLASAAPGQPGTLVCKSTLTGATTQSIAIGNTVFGSGGIGGALSRHDDSVLVTDIAGGAVLFEESHGRLVHRVQLNTGGEDSVSGAIGAHGAYVVTRTRLMFFPRGHATARSTADLMIGDSSASQVVLAGGHAYVSEKSGSLEAFALGADGRLDGAATPVTGIPAGTIVGMTGLDDLVVSPVAHLASNANQAAVPVTSGDTTVQLVATKEVAACWAANDNGEVCITNPGSMTVSCGHFGPGGFTTYTSAAANPAGDSVLDLDMRYDLVGILGTHDGARVLMVYVRSDEGSDFLTSIREIAVGSAMATGALLLPPVR